MTELLATGAGFALGTLFFGGLWWTVKRGVTSRQPALWFLPSLILRAGMVLWGFYLLADGRWQRLLFGLLGFLAARITCSWLTRPRRIRSANHAP
jgi:F1F0 ATPase subunit 2